MYKQLLISCFLHIVVAFDTERLVYRWDWKAILRQNVNTLPEIITFFKTIPYGYYYIYIYFICMFSVLWNQSTCYYKMVGLWMGLLFAFFGKHKNYFSSPRIPFFKWQCKANDIYEKSLLFLFSKITHHVINKT